MWGRFSRSVCLLVLCGCSTQTIERRTLPAALADHVASLPTFDAASHIVVPVGRAWNASLEAVRSVAPIAGVDPSSLAIQTHPRYEETLAAGVRSQVRSRYDIRFSRDPRRGLRAEVMGDAARRTRGVCGPASEFAPIQADPSALVTRVDAAIDALRRAPLSEFVFDADPGTLATALLGAESIYTITLGYGADGAPFVEAVGRESAAARRGVVIEVRSSYRASFVPADGGTRVLVTATLEHRTSDEEAAGAFVADDPARIVEAVYGMLAGLVPVRDLLLADQTPQIVMDQPPLEPELTPASDDLRGTFDLHVAFMSEPRSQRDASFFGGLERVYVVVDDGAGSRRVSDASPVYGVSDWLARGLRFDLTGDTVFSIALSNAPVSEPAMPAREIAYGRASAQALLLACDSVCFDGDGGSVCVTLSRP